MARRQRWLEDRDGWLRTNREKGIVSGDRQRVGCCFRRSAFENDLGLELAGVGGGGGVDFGGEEDEEGGDDEGFHCGCLVD